MTVVFLIFLVLAQGGWGATHRLGIGTYRFGIGTYRLGIWRLCVGTCHTQALYNASGRRDRRRTCGRGGGGMAHFVVSNYAVAL